jgi:hypothetical protein
MLTPKVSTFILVILSLDCHILLALNKRIMSQSSITLGDLGILAINALI